jgi:hypothetical protein
MLRPLNFSNQLGEVEHIHNTVSDSQLWPVVDFLDNFSSLEAFALGLGELVTP